jgi:hypothetical protein
MSCCSTAVLLLPLLLLSGCLQELEKLLKGQQAAHDAELRPLQEKVGKLQHSNEMHQVRWASAAASCYLLCLCECGTAALTSCLADSAWHCLFNVLLGPYEER